MAKVETVDWGGKTWRRYPEANSVSDRSYYQRSTTGGIVRLHRAIWEHHNGPIPSGHHIHHIDGDPTNNDINNLECVSPRDHINLHFDDERRQKQREWMDSIRPLASEWHRSEEGREFHRKIGGLAYQNYEPTTETCDCCGEEFSAKGMHRRGRFCSNKCKSAYRRATGVDDETRQCEACGDDYRVNRYRKQRTCSRSCANRIRKRSVNERNDDLTTKGYVRRVRADHAGGP